MDFDRLNRWMTLAANVGVLAGIVFLAFEIRQNERAVTLDYELALLDSASLDVSRFAEQRAIRLQSRELTTVWLDGREGKELDEIDQARFESMCFEAVWSDALMHDRSVALGRHTSADQTVRSRRALIDRFPGFRRCWDGTSENLKAWGYTSFVDLVNDK